MNKDEWYDRLCVVERELGLNDGFRPLYGPWSTLSKSRMAFISLNPGRAPSSTTKREMSDERGNSYVVERESTLSPITDQFLRLCALIKVSPDDVLTGVAVPFRTPAWNDIPPQHRKRAIKVGQEFWAEPLKRNDLEVIVCCSAQATRAVVECLHAKLEETRPAAWGNITIHRYRALNGTPILALPHLSRFRLLGRSQSETAIADLLDHR
jgi:hypothetical protein